MTQDRTAIGATCDKHQYSTHKTTSCVTEYQNNCSTTNPHPNNAGPHTTTKSATTLTVLYKTLRLYIA